MVYPPDLKTRKEPMKLIPIWYKVSRGADNKTWARVCTRCSNLQWLTIFPSNVRWKCQCLPGEVQATPGRNYLYDILPNSNKRQLLERFTVWSFALLDVTAANRVSLIQSSRNHPQRSYERQLIVQSTCKSKGQPHREHTVNMPSNRAIRLSF